ncbi:DUF1513 domain-containing protein [uncultured Roseobacter sp.]|uniref:DUF1513 domain-containing protein n=1 Tax=uncultured Roseobacter sp. TaxID=114847 RepID=UPI00261F7723|nr:DUF1513 domain-containing protein [uncultured Roseobacter sp.]
MQTRRSFMQATAAAATFPTTSWAAAGAPTHLSAARKTDGSYHLVGLRGDGRIAFTQPLPGRGHAAAAHPDRAEAVAFARRPGTFALVLECSEGTVLQRLHAPEGRHFYGHGAFSRDGRRLYTTENEIETGAGRIGLWDASNEYRRLGELSSNGIGPHEIIRLPGTDTLAIANGGIRTHPDTGREKLNLDTMQPNLALMSAEGEILEAAELPAPLHQNSLRHIAGFNDGRVACAFQWQGDVYASPSIVGLYTPGVGLQLLEMDSGFLYGLDGYAGSIATVGGNQIGITFPRGGVAQIIDLKRETSKILRRADICGIARANQDALATDGLGGVQRIDAGGTTTLAQHPLAFDNHLIAIG